MGKFSFGGNGGSQPGNDAPKQENQFGAADPIQKQQFAGPPDGQDNPVTEPKRFAFLKDKVKVDNPSGQNKSTEPSSSNQ